MSPQGKTLTQEKAKELAESEHLVILCGHYEGYYRDADGFYFYVGRIDDVIKSSGYRIGPFEIESVIMELPYVPECGVSAAPDEVRGQVVTASIVLTKDTVPSDELKKEIQSYVKEHTAPYKYPVSLNSGTLFPKEQAAKLSEISFNKKCSVNMLAEHFFGCIGAVFVLK